MRYIAIDLKKYSVEYLCKVFNKSDRTIHRWKSEGQIPFTMNVITNALKL